MFAEAHQTDLLELLQEQELAELDRHEREFLEFIEQHPDVWEAFERIALELIAEGRTHYGSKAIIEQVRFHMRTSSREPKIQNNHTAYFARRFVRLHPEHRGFFRFRKTAAERAAEQRSRGEQWSSGSVDG